MTDADRGDSFTPTGLDAVDGSAEAAKAAADAAKAAEDKAAADKKAADNAAAGKGEELDADGKPKSKVIPRERLEAAQRKAKQREEAYQQRIEELEQANAQGRVNVDVNRLQSAVDAAEDKYEELILDGKKAEAKQIRQQISRMKDALVDMRAYQHASQAQAVAIDSVNYDRTLEAAEERYPVLNPDTDEFDSDKADEVAEMMEAFQAKGYGSAQALQMSLRYCMAEIEADAGSALRTAREKAAREKAADALKRTPGDITNLGLNSDAAGKKGDGQGPNVMKMSQEAFSKLDEETKAKLRGDDFVGS